MHGPFAWTSEKFALHALTYGREKQVFEAGGRQHLAWTDEAGGAHSLSFLPAELHASAVSDGHGLARFDLDILDAGGTDTAGHPFTAGRLQLHLRRDPKGDGLDLAVSGDAVKNVAGIPPFGTAIRSLRASGILNHGAAFAPLLQGEASLPQADADWRRAGGIAKFDRPQGLSAGQMAALKTLLSPLY